MTRDEFDALLREAVTNIGAAIAPDPSDPASLSEQRDAIEEAELLDAEAVSFADAVDRDGKRIPYGSAIVLEGPHGVTVIQARDYADAPLYWHTVVGGRPDRITSGPELLEVLTGAANRAPAQPK